MKRILHHSFIAILMLVGILLTNSCSKSVDAPVVDNSPTTPAKHLKDAPVIGASVYLMGINGQFVSSNGDGTNAMICNRTSASTWETFTIVDAGGGYIALKSSFGKYVSGSTPMYCNAASIGATEKFTWTSPAAGQVQFKCSANNLYVCSENGTTSMNCNRTSASGWETFNYSYLGAASVNYYLTNADGSSKFAQQSPLAWGTSANSYPSITVNTGTTYQSIDGFGMSLTEGSAELINGLNASVQSNLLTELFSPTSGIGISVLRISIGASDLGSSSYSYQDFKAYTGTAAPIGSYVRLQATSNGKFVTSNGGSTTMICDRGTPSAWETFKVVDAGGGLIALQSSDGKYISGISPMWCSATSINAYEKFSWVCPTAGQVQLKCSANNLFACSENGTTAMNCNRTSASGWETYNVQAAIFSLAGPDLNNVVPLLKKILAINPNIKIMATPWSAPTWMKSSLSWIGGSLQPAYYDAYATYFKNFFDAMKAQGINIWGITPQNEPLCDTNEPSMAMSQDEQLAFINNNLGPAIRNAGYSAKIIAYDHNCDVTSYAEAVCKGSSYVDGSAFHLYKGSISAMGDVKKSTEKNVYFTEQYTGPNGNFGGDLNWHMNGEIIGAMNNWAKITMEWNLASNPSCGPHTPGGSNNSQGALTISSSTDVTRNIAYYLIAHLSKFVRPDAVRVNSVTTDGNLLNVAFTSGTNKVLLVFNNNPTATTFNIKYSGSWVTTTLQSGSAATYVWN